MAKWLDDIYTQVYGDNGKVTPKQKKQEDKGFFDNFNVTDDVADPTADFFGTVGGGIVQLVTGVAKYADKGVGYGLKAVGAEETGEGFLDFANILDEGGDKLAKKVANTVSIGKNEMYEGLVEDKSQKDIPYYGDLVTYKELKKVSDSAERYNKGNYTKEDLQVLQEYLDREEELNQKRNKTSYVVGEGIRNSLTYGGEIYLAVQTAGAGAGEMAVEKTAVTALKQSIKKAVDKSIKKQLKKELFKKSLKRGIAKWGTADLIFNSTNSPTGVLQRTMPKVNLATGEVEDGQELSDAVINSISENTVSLASEFSGGIYGALFNKLPTGVRDTFVKNAVIQTMKKKMPQLTDNTIGKLVKQVGWHGLMGEFMEEQHEKWANAVLAEAGLGDNAWQPYTMKDITQTLLTLGAFSTMMKKVSGDVVTDEGVKKEYIGHKEALNKHIEKALEVADMDTVVNKLVDKGADPEGAEAVVKNIAKDKVKNKVNKISKSIKQAEKQIDEETPEQVVERLSNAGENQDNIIDVLVQDNGLELQDAIKLVQDKAKDNLSNEAEEDDFSDIAEEFENIETQFDKTQQEPEQQDTTEPESIDFDNYVTDKKLIKEGEKDWNENYAPRILEITGEIYDLEQEIKNNPDTEAENQAKIDALNNERMEMSDEFNRKYKEKQDAISNKGKNKKNKKQVKASEDVENKGQKANNKEKKQVKEQSEENKGKDKKQDNEDDEEYKYKNTEGIVKDVAKNKFFDITTEADLLDYVIEYIKENNIDETELSEIPETVSRIYKKMTGSGATDYSDVKPHEDLKEIVEAKTIDELEQNNNKQKDETKTNKKSVGRSKEISNISKDGATDGDTMSGSESGANTENTESDILDGDATAGDDISGGDELEYGKDNNFKKIINIYNDDRLQELMFIKNGLPKNLKIKDFSEHPNHISDDKFLEIIEEEKTKFENRYGNNKQEKLEIGDLSPTGNFRKIDDIKYSLYKDNRYKGHYALVKFSNNKLDKKTSIKEEPKTKSTRKTANERATEILETHNYSIKREDYTSEEIAELQLYTGEGGFGRKADKEGTYNEYYTSKKLVKAVVDLARGYVKFNKVLEPSVGTGNFLSEFENNEVDAYEFQKISGTITKILYPKVNIQIGDGTDSENNIGDFQSLFYDAKNNKAKKITKKYDAVIGNPPFGARKNFYTGLGEEKSIKRWEDYFVKRGLDVLNEGGVLSYVLSTTFLNQAKNLDKIAKLGKLVDAYRLPEGMFSGTDIPTDIVVFKRKTTKDAEEIEKRKDTIKNWFKNNPDKVLGEITTKSNRFGGETETVVTDLTPEEVLLKIQPKEASTIELVETEVKTKEGKQKTVKKVRTNKKKEEKKKEEVKKITTEAVKGKTKIFYSPDFTQLDEKEKEVLHEASSNEFKIVEYSKEKEPYISADPELSAQLGGEVKWVPNKWYYTGNIIKKIKQLENSTIIDEKVKERQLAKLNEIKPEHKKFNDIDISWKDENFKKQLVKLQGQEYEDTIENVFAGWNGFVRETEFYLPAGVSKWDIINLFNNGKIEKDKKKLLKEMNQTLNQIWGRFLITLPEEFKQQYEIEYNDRLNNYIHPNYNYFPVAIEGVVDTLSNGNPFTPTPAQRHGIAFLNNKNKGLIAYGTGVGKTYTMILSVKAQMDKGRAKRPLFIVPKPTLQNTWINSIKEILPNMSILNLGGLTKGDVTRLVAERGKDPAKWAKDGEMILITKEGMERLGIDTSEYGEFDDIAYDYVKISYSDAKPEKTKGVKSEFLGALKGYPEYDFQKFGIDLIAVDEVHNYRKVVSTPQKLEKKGTKKVYRIPGNDSNNRSKKLFALTRYIQKKYDGNVFLASATPFENNPLEIYSILQYIGYDELAEAQIANANQFFDKFAKFTFSLEISKTNEPEEKEIIKSFSNVTELQTVLTSLMDYKEDPSLIVPEKKVHTPILQMSEAQETNRATIEDMMKSGDTGDVLRGIQASESNTLSPFLFDYTDYIDEKNGEEISIKEGKTVKKVKIDIDKVIEDSPKLKYTVESIKQLTKSKKKHKGTFAYFGNIGINKGAVEVFEKYIIKHKILKKNEIAKIIGSVSDEKKVKAMNDFNDGTVRLIIGSSSASEGIDLQKNGAHTVVLQVYWNPTTLTQVFGRSWRQGNPMAEHNISIPLVENSLDPFKFSKYSEKASRINSIFSNIKVDGDMFDFEEIDPDEQKIALISDINSKTKAYFDIQKKQINNEIGALDSYAGKIKDKLFELKQVEKDIANYQEEIQMLKDREKSIKEYIADNNKYGYTDEDLKTNDKKIKEAEKKLANSKKLYEARKEKIKEKDGLQVDEMLQTIKDTEAKIAELETKKSQLDSEENRAIVYEKFKKEYEETVAKRVKPEDLISKIIKSVEDATEYTKEELAEMKRQKLIELGYDVPDKKPEDTKQDEVVKQQKTKKKSTSSKAKKTKPTKTKQNSKNSSKPKLTKTETGIWDIITDKELTPEEKVDKLLDRKQQNKEIKDYGERVSGSKKENAVIRLVLQYGDKATIEELTDALGYEAMVKQLNGKAIVEQHLPDNFDILEAEKEKGHNIFIANTKKLLLESILKTPKLYHTERDRWGNNKKTLFSLTPDSKHYDEWRPNYNYTDQQTPLSGKEEAVKEFVANYETFIKSAVDAILEAKNVEELKGVTATFDTENFSFDYRTIFNTNNFVYNGSSLVKNQPFRIDPHLEALSKIEDIESSIKYNEQHNYKEMFVINEPYYTSSVKNDNPDYRDLLDYFEGFSSYRLDKTSLNPEDIEKIVKDTKQAINSFKTIKEKFLNDYSKIPVKEARSESNITDKSHGNFEKIEEYDVKDDRYKEDFVTSENLAKVFGFKSVQLGNYMDDKSAKEHILQTMGAIEDMSSIINIDFPKIINDKGLSIAFGARGGGKALAHYEPTKNIINLTKKRGDGSFGHEFGHFLDYQFGHITSKYKKNQRRYRISEEAEFLLMSEIMDTYRKEYVEKTFEPQPQSNAEEMVVEWVSEFIKAGKTDIKELIKEHYGRSEEIAQEYANQTLKPVKVKIKERVQTYLEKVIEFTGKENSYWTKKEEMFARAFQAYLEDKMKEKGIVNSYVTRPTDHPVYPQGEQRKDINERFDALFVKLAGKPDDSILKYRIESGKEYLEQNNKNIETLKDRKDNVLVKDFAISGIKDEKEAVKTYRDAFRDIKKLEDEIGKDTVDDLLNYLSYNEPTTKDGVISIDEWVKEVENYSENSKIVDKKSIAERLHKIQNRIIDSVKFFAKQDSENNNTDGMSKYVLDENADWDDIERRLLNISNRFYNQINEDFSIDDRIEEYKKRNKEIESNIKELEKELENLTDNKKRFEFKEARFKKEKLSANYGDLGYNFLKDYQKRHGVKFDTHWVDAILTQAGNAYGIYYDGTIAIKKGLEQTTVVAHEILHLTLDNLEKLPKFKEFSKDELLKEQARLMGVKLTDANRVEVEEKLANNFESYLYGKRHIASSKIKAFFYKLMRRLQKLVELVRGHNNMIRDFYDELAFGSTIAEKEVEIENNSIIDNLVSLVDGKRVILDPTNSKSKAGLTDLEKEALKYETPEEFIREQKIVYHGTNAIFDKFDMNKIGSNFSADTKGIFFTSDMQEAMDYANEAYTEHKVGKPNIKEAIVIIKNPYKIDAKFANAQQAYDISRNEIEKKLKTGEYDGVIVKNIKATEEELKESWRGANDGGDLYMVLDTSQIKTKEQLHKIWEEAHKKNNLFFKKGHKYSPLVAQLEETYKQQQKMWENTTYKVAKKQLEKSLADLAEQIAEQKEKEDLTGMMFKLAEEKQFINTKDKFNKLNIKLHKVEKTITQKIDELNESMVGRADIKASIDTMKAYQKLDRMRYIKGDEKGKFTEKGIELLDKLGVTVEEAEKNIKQIAKFKAEQEELKEQSKKLREQISELKKTDKGLKKKVSETKRRMAFISQKLNVLKDNINKAKGFKKEYNRDERRVMAQTAVKLAKLANKTDVDLLEKAIDLEKVDIYNMNSEEFYNYLEQLTELSNTAIEKYFTYQEIQQLIARKNLKRVEQISLFLFGKSDFRKLSKKNLERLKEFVINTRKNEHFLPKTLMEKLTIYKQEKGYDDMSLLTVRELIKEVGLDPKDIRGNRKLNMFIGGWVFRNRGEFEKFLQDAVVRVNAMANSKHEARMDEIAKLVNEARKARAQEEGWTYRVKSLFAKHDELIAEYIQAPNKEQWEQMDEKERPKRPREELVRFMLPEEIKAGDAMINVYKEHLAFLEQYGLKSRFNGWYMPHKEKGFMEKVVWDNESIKIKELMGKAILSDEKEKKMANVFYNNGEQVAYWKFFNHMLRRGEGTDPSLDVLETFRTYDLAIEKKKELDKVVPLISGVVNIAIHENKEQGDMLNQQVKQFLNDLKGRKVRDPLIQQGGKIDRFLKDSSSWFYFKTLAFGVIFNSVNTYGAVAGGVAQMHETQHWRRFLGNLKYMFNDDVWQHIEGFVPESPLKSWQKSGKSIHDFVSIWGYSGMAIADTLSKRMVYLSRLSKEDINNIEKGAIEKAFNSLADIDAEVTQFLQTNTSASMYGKTGTGRELKTFKSWAFPTLLYTVNSTLTIINHLMKAIAKKDVKQFTKQDWIAVKQIAILAGYSWAISALLSSLADCEGEDKHSLRCQFFSKAQRDADLFWQSITLPAVFFKDDDDTNKYNDVYHFLVPKIAYLTDSINHLKQAFAGEKMAGTDINKGLLEIRNDLNPTLIQQFTGREGWWSVKEQYQKDLMNGRITPEDYAKYVNDNKADWAKKHNKENYKVWDELEIKYKKKKLQKAKQRKALYKRFGLEDTELFFDRLSRVNTNEGKAMQLTLPDEEKRLKPIIKYIRSNPPIFRKQLKHGYNNAIISDNLYKLILNNWKENKKERSQ